MPRIVMVFQLSGTQAQDDLVREFALHDGLDARASSVAGRPAVVVEAEDNAAAVWEVRATVGMFDDYAVELPRRTEPQ